MNLIEKSSYYITYQSDASVEEDIVDGPFWSHDKAKDALCLLNGWRHKPWCYQVKEAKVEINFI